MPVPNPIGPIHFDEPRAVQVREPEDVQQVHSAVYGAIAVYVDTKQEADAVISSWSVIMQCAADKATEIIAAVREKQEAVTT